MKMMKKRILSGLMVAALMMGAAPARAVEYQGTDSYQTGKFYRALQEVKLTGDPRQDIVNIALSQVGYQEGAYFKELSGEIVGNANFTEYGDWYEMQDQWCAMFVSWCAALADISEDVVPRHSYTPTGLYQMKDKWGRAYSREKVEQGMYTPQPGDIIYFKSPTTKNTTNHVGIVTGYRDGVVYTVEGNTSSPALFSGGGTVARKSYPITNSYIVYICCPDYEGTGQKVKNGITKRSLAQKETALQETLILLESGSTATYDRVECSPDGAVSLGCGQWSGNQAKAVVAEIYNADPQAFTSGELAKLLTLDWAEFRPSQGQRECLQAALATDTGILVQQRMLQQQIDAGQALAQELGVTQPEAKLACGALYCLGGGMAVRQAVSLGGTELTSRSICNTMDSMGYAGAVILEALN